MMDEYIKREEAIEAAKHAWAKGLEPSQYLEIIPAEDVAPVRHARWKSYGKNLGECSECGEIVSVRSNYCPNCGADMRGSNDE